MKEPSECYIFGYGSLINKESIKKTLNRDIQEIIPVVLTKDIGYRRKWCFCSDKHKMCALGITESDDPKDINGVLFKCTQNELKLLDNREEGYTRIKIEHRYIKKFFNNSNVSHFDIAFIQIFTYKVNNEQTYNDDYPIKNFYKNTCIDGCKDINEEFVNDFIKSLE